MLLDVTAAVAAGMLAGSAGDAKDVLLAVWASGHREMIASLFEGVAGRVGKRERGREEERARESERESKGGREGKRRGNAARESHESGEERNRV